VPGTTVRIGEETRQALRELERQTGYRTSELLALAVEQYRRSLILDVTNRAYAALRTDPEAWAEVEAEREEWEGTLADGLEDDPPASA
jgi:ADP-ribose pyrophosphatase YjhB (NUDIX family)